MRYLFTPLLFTSLMLLTATGLDWNENLTWHDQHRIEQIGLLGAVALAALVVWRQDIVSSVMRLPCWVRVMFVLAFSLGLGSALGAAFPRFAALEWATLLLLLGLVLLLAEEARRAGARFDKWAIWLAVALAVVIALKIMAGYVAALVEGVLLDTLWLFEGTFSNRRVFGQVASMLVPLLAYPLLTGERSRLQRWGLFGLLAVWWMLVIVSGTRGTWLGLMVATLVLGLAAWQASMRWLRLQVLAAVTGVGLFVLLFVWIPVWAGLSASVESRLSNFADLSGRAELWHLAWVQVVAHPWLGIGPMHLAAIRNDFGAHPHNSLLQLAAEWGVPAALALVLPVLAGMASLLARLRKNIGYDVLLVCLTAGLLAASVQSMVDGVIVIPYTQTLLALIAGWALGVYFRGASRVVPDTRLLRLGVPVVSLVAFSALMYGIYPEVFNRAEVTQAYADAGKYIPPRYWGVGWIP